MGQYLIDNNVISNYFSGLFSENGMHFIGEVIDQIPNISVITQIEALSWINPDQAKEKIVQEFINDANILTLAPEIINQSVMIRRSRKIKTPDAAIIHRLTLITNDSDLNNIQGLKIIDPHLI